MSHDTDVAPGHSRRAITAAFGEVASTLDWNHTAWLMLRLEIPPMHELRLVDVVVAIDETRGRMEVHAS